MIFPVLGLLFHKIFVILDVSINLRPHSGEYKALVAAELRRFARLAVEQASREKAPPLGVGQLLHTFYVAVIGTKILSGHQLSISKI